MKPSLWAALALVVLSQPLTQAQTNLLSDPGLEAAEAASDINPFWVLDANRPNETGLAAQYQMAPWASNPSGTSGIGIWLRAFEGAEGEEEIAANATLTQLVEATPGLLYELSVWHKVETNYISASTVLALDFLNAADEILLSQALELNGLHPADGSWVQFTIKATAPEGTVKAQARAQMIDGVNANANPQSAMFDDFSLTAGAPPQIASVVGSEGNAQGLSILAEDAGDSVVDANTATLSIDGASVAVTATKEGAITTFTHTPSAPFADEARLPWLLRIEDGLGNEILGEGLLRIPGSLIYGGGKVTTQQVLRTDLQVNSLDVALEALDQVDDAEALVTVETAFVHFDDGALPPFYIDLSKPYPLFDPALNGDATLAGSDNYAIRSTGEFYLKEGGLIPFVVNSDDGFDLRIDEISVGNAGNRGRMDSIMVIELAVGLHSFELIQWEAAGAAGVSFLIGRLPLLEDEIPPNVTEEFYELMSGYDVHNVVTGDSDGDGMDDFRETAFFGNLERDGTGDFDSDGLNDRAELDLRADPDVQDTDGDGLEDGPEVATHGSSPALADTDGDNLTDGREVNELKTDPAKADTDDDDFADNVELALGTDPLSDASKPSTTIAVASGLWNAAGTWKNGVAPQAGASYSALGEITPNIISAPGTFAGDLLELRGPDLTLRLEHDAPATANLSLINAKVLVDTASALTGVLTIEGDVRVDVGNGTFRIGSQLRGSGNLTLLGGDPEMAAGQVILSGSGSQFDGSLAFRSVDAIGETPGSLGTGSITIEDGVLTFDYNFSSPAAILSLQGSSFELVLNEDVAVRDLTGISKDGDFLFSLFEVTGESGPFTADQLQTILGLQDGDITGNGTLTLLRDAGDLDNDGLRDSWEVEQFGNTDALPEADPDGDGLTNLAEQTAATDPNEADTDGDTLSDGDEITLHRTDPSQRDSDADGVDDQEELALNLNPINADTDGDGLSDGVEIATTMTMPNNADSDGDGFSDKLEIDNGIDPNDAASQPNQFLVRTVVREQGEIQNLSDARAVRDGLVSGLETLALHDTLNFTDNLEVTAILPDDVLFDGEPSDHFIVHAIGKFTVPSTGPWGIGFNSDDGGQLIIDGSQIITFDGTRGRNNTMQTLTLTKGVHTLEVLMFDRIGGAALEVYRASAMGDRGEVVNGTLPVGFEPIIIAFDATDSPALPVIESITRSESALTLQVLGETAANVAFSSDLQSWQMIGPLTGNTFSDADPGRLQGSTGYYRLEKP